VYKKVKKNVITCVCVIDCESVIIEKKKSLEKNWFRFRERIQRWPPCLIVSCSMQRRLWLVTWLVWTNQRSCLFLLSQQQTMRLINWSFWLCSRRMRCQWRVSGTNGRICFQRIQCQTCQRWSQHGLDVGWLSIQLFPRRMSLCFWLVRWCYRHPEPYPIPAYGYPNPPYPPYKPPRPHGLKPPKPRPHQASVELIVTTNTANNTATTFIFWLKTISIA